MKEEGIDEDRGGEEGEKLNLHRKKRTYNRRFSP